MWVADYRVPWLTTSSLTWCYKSLIINAHLCRNERCIWQEGSLYICPFSTKFEKIWLKIKEIISHTLTCGWLLGQPLWYTIVPQYFKKYSVIQWIFNLFGESIYNDLFFRNSIHAIWILNSSGINQFCIVVYCTH